MTSIPRIIIKYSFYILFFLTPLLFFPWTFELFEFNKMMFVYLMTTIITGAWLTHALLTRSVPVKRTPLDIPILLFLTSQIISTIYSINVHTSLIGYYSRFHGGLLSTLSYILLYYAFVTFGRIENEELRMENDERKNYPLSIIHYPFVRTCLNLLLTSVTLVSIYGIAEHFGIDKHMWVQDVQRRVFSTLGQPNWLAALLIMVLPLTLAMSISSSSRIYHLLSAIFYATLLFTKSRSGLLGFSLMYAVFWFLLFLKGKFPWKKFVALSIILLALSAYDGLSWFSPVNRLSDYLTNRLSLQPSALSVQRSAPEAPIYRGEGGTESGDIRKIVWRGALDIWRHYPYFGSGVETFAYSYYNFRPVEHNLVSEWDFLYNKAHNEYLNLLATTGAFGLASYLLLQLSVFILLLKQTFSSSKLSIIHYPLSISLISGLAGVSVSNFFGFSTVSVSLLFFLYPALAVVLSAPAQNSKLNAKGNHPSIKIVPLSITLLAFSFMLFALAKWYLADINFASGKRYAESGYLAEAFPQLDRATRLLPSEPMYHNEFSSVAAEVALAFHSKNATDSAQQAIELALKESEITRTQNPVHLNFVKTRARVMFTLAQINPIFLQEAKNTLLKGLELSPTDPKLMYNLALLYDQLDQPDLALQTLQKTLDMKPNYEAAKQSLEKLQP